MSKKGNGKKKRKLQFSVWQTSSERRIISFYGTKKKTDSEFFRNQIKDGGSRRENNEQIDQRNTSTAVSTLPQ
jgi:hypothetical protein